MINHEVYSQKVANISKYETNSTSELYNEQENVHAGNLISEIFKLGR